MLLLKGYLLIEKGYELDFNCFRKHNLYPQLYTNLYYFCYYYIYHISYFSTNNRNLPAGGGRNYRHIFYGASSQFISSHINP